MQHQSRIYKRLNRMVGKAVHRYDMITDGDRIAVGLSGGMDSLFLIRVLHERLRRIPIHYDLVAIHIDPGFDGGFSDQLASYCSDEGYALRVEYTDYGVLGHSSVNRALKPGGVYLNAHKHSDGDGNSIRTEELAHIRNCWRRAS